MTKAGRVSIPSRFREVCRNKYSDESFVVTNFDKYLIAYPLKEWNILEEKLSKISMTDTKAVSFVRYFMGNAVDCRVDNQGRILIPQSLRTYAGIENDVVLIGMGDKVEIWAKQKCEHESGVAKFETFNQSSDTLAEYGL